MLTRDARDLAHFTRHEKALRRLLLGWYAQVKRTLPWRDVSDPYKILVSEFMLQQTQVTTVLPYFERFLARFPSLEDLARADEKDVLAVWSGLGYYSRARNLRATARAIVNTHEGNFPLSLSVLKELPGVGEYTARALASLIHEIPTAVVDGNVSRVLTRLLSLREPSTTAGSKRHVQRVADRLLSPHRPGDWNQAMMELGATVCTSTSPQCTACPWGAYCSAYKSGNQESFPVKPPSVSPRRVVRALAVYEKSGMYLLVQRLRGSQLRGTWELPGTDFPPRGKPRVRLRRYLEETLHLEFKVGRELAQTTHSITNKRIFVRAFAVSPGRGRAIFPDAKWILKSKLDTVFISSMTKKILDQLSSSQAV